MRSLSGRRSCHTCGYRTLFPSDPSGTYHQERDPVEEKPSVFSGVVSFRTENTGTLKMVMVSAYALDTITIFSIRRKQDRTKA